MTSCAVTKFDISAIMYIFLYNHIDCCRKINLHYFCFVFLKQDYKEWFTVLNEKTVDHKGFAEQTLTPSGSRENENVCNILVVDKTFYKLKKDNIKNSCVMRMRVCCFS